jgi:hypothetical protein
MCVRVCVSLCVHYVCTTCTHTATPARASQPRSGGRVHIAGKRGDTGKRAKGAGEDVEHGHAGEGMCCCAFVLGGACALCLFAVQRVALGSVLCKL